MTLSIIRRFAKYHDIEIKARNQASAILYFAAMLWVPGTVTLDVARDNIVKSLTLIEEAEILLAKRVTSVSHGIPFLGVRAAYEEAAHDMLTRAGVDPQIWSKVSE